MVRIVSSEGQDNFWEEIPPFPVFVVGQISANSARQTTTLTLDSTMMITFTLV